MAGQTMADMESDEEKKAAELELRDGHYLLSVIVSPGVTLSIEVERKSDGCQWRGDFTARYIEDITQRAGNVKSFSNFVKMLRSATSPSRAKSLHVDVLTYQDLAMLKGGNSTNGSSSSNIAATDKRYLILTYTTDFDRVHYPLPLLHEDVPETSVMRRCIQRLRNELKSMKNRLRKYEAPQAFDHRTKSAASNEDEYNYSEMKRYYDKPNRPSNLEMQNSQILKTRALQEEVKGLQNKLRLEGIAHKKLATTLMRKNTLLQEEARQARVAEGRLSGKLRDSEFQIGLLRGRLKPRGVASNSSPLRTRPRTSDSPPASRCVQQGWLRPSPSPPPSRYAQLGQSFVPSRSHMSSPRYSNSTPPRFRTSGGCRSRSCPTPRARKAVEMNDWQAKKLKQREAMTPITTTRRIWQGPSLEPPTARRSGNSRRQDMDDAVSEVGEIDSRLYALRDYLKRANTYGKK